MKNTIYFLCLLVGLLISTFACKKDEVDPLIDPADSQALSEVLIFPDDANQRDGTPPSSSSSGSAPLITNLNEVAISSNGAAVPLLFRYNNVSGNLAGCYVQVVGSDEFYEVPYNNNSGSSGELQLPIGIPTNVTEGTFYVDFYAFDRDGRISNVETTEVTVLRLGTGALQISLTWNTATDQDLHVTDPSGTEIYFLNEFSETGGQLDRDDLDGFGPENIFWLDNAPDGEYIVEVNDYEETRTPNTYYITVSGKNVSRQFEGTTQNGSMVEVTRFTKDGDNIRF